MEQTAAVAGHYHDCSVRGHLRGSWMGGSRGEELGKATLPWPRRFLESPNGIPSHDTFGRVFGALDPEQFEQSFGRRVEALAQRTAGHVLALDGKTLRRSHDQSAERQARCIWSAPGPAPTGWCSLRWQVAAKSNGDHRLSPAAGAVGPAGLHGDH